MIDASMGKTYLFYIVLYFEYCLLCLPPFRPIVFIKPFVKIFVFCITNNCPRKTLSVFAFENIYPKETEDLLIMHPKVADVAVFGIPNEEMGEEVDDYQTTEALEEIENDRENEEIDEEQEYDASSIGYEDTNGSSSSFAAYTDQEMNQKSQR